MQKIMLSFLGLMLVLTLVACSGTNSSEGSQNDYFSKVFEEYDKKIEAIEKENENLKHSIEESKDELLENREEYLSLINEQEAQIIALKDKISSIEGGGENPNSQLEELKNKLEILETQLAETKASFEEKQLELEKEMKKMKSQIELREGFYLNIFDTSNTLEKNIQHRSIEIENISIEEVIIRLRHPLSDKIDNQENILYEKTITNGDSFSSDMKVDFHGYYELLVDINYQYDNENYSYQMIYQVFYRDNHYNLSWIPASMPVLLFASDLMYDTYQGSTYVEIERAKTYNFDKLPENAYKYPTSISASKGNYDQGEILNFYDNINHESSNLLIEWIKELEHIDSRSTFTIITIDMWQYLIPSITLSGLDFTKFDFKLYTDGTASSSTISANYTDLESFDKLKNEINNIIQNNLEGKTRTTYFNEKYMFALSALDNFEYILNSTDNLPLEQDLKDTLHTLNIKILPVYEALNRLSTSSLKDLEYLLNTRWGENDDESMSSYFNGEPGKNLLILGTSPAAEISQPSYADFDKYIEHISLNYGAEYKIFYKGHPRYPSDETRKELFVNHNIVELPNSIPVETLMLLYPEVYVGGYYSTSFLSSLKDQTIFFFGNKSFISNNVAIANMFRDTDIFDQSVFLYKETDGSIGIENN